MIRPLTNRLARVGGITLCVVLLFLCLPYGLCPIYDFPQPKPFHGESLYNPYGSDAGRWYKSNFASHSNAWWGITNGKNSNPEILQAYSLMGYDIVSFGDYEKISPPCPDQDIYISNYEHGYNIWKRHHIVLGAKDVDWFDLVFLQTIHQKQYILRRLKESCEILAISHPTLRDAFTLNDMRLLMDYDCVEVNTRFSSAEDFWDAALSAGKPVWVLNDDDTHNAESKEETGRFWTMIFSASDSPSDIYDAMRKGRMYGVSGNEGVMDNELHRLAVDGNEIKIDLTYPARAVQFIGQDGKVESEIRGDVRSAMYTFGDSDTYIRARIVNGRTTFLLNPVYRYEETPLQHLTASVDWFWSVIYWCTFWLCYGFVTYLLLGKIYPRRLPSISFPVLTRALRRSVG
jgi:hypothetical protein